MKILIVGCGSIGLRHLRNIKKLGDHDVIVFRTSCDNIADFEKNYAVKVATNYNKALDQKPEAVIISNPTSLHIPYAIQAAERGIHLLIEKPLSHSMDGVDYLIETIERKKLKVLIGCNLRFHKQLIKIKQLLDQNAIGTVYFAKLSVGAYLPEWRPKTNYSKSYSSIEALGGGVVLDLIHEIDYALWFFGTVVGINATIYKLSNLEIETEDYAEIFLKFKNGTALQIHLDYLNRFPNRTCEIIGEFGNISWDYNQQLLEVSNVKNLFIKRFKLRGFDRNDMYVDEIRHFFNCLTNKQTPLVTIYDGKRALEVALAAKKIGENNIKRYSI